MLWMLWINRLCKSQSRPSAYHCANLPRGLPKLRQTWPRCFLSNLPDKKWRWQCDNTQLLHRKNHKEASNACLPKHPFDLLVGDVRIKCPCLAWAMHELCSYAGGHLRKTIRIPLLRQLLKWLICCSCDKVVAVLFFSCRNFSGSLWLTMAHLRVCRTWRSWHGESFKAILKVCRSCLKVTVLTGEEASCPGRNSPAMSPSWLSKKCWPSMVLLYNTRKMWCWFKAR